MVTKRRKTTSEYEGRDLEKGTTWYRPTTDVDQPFPRDMRSHEILRAVAAEHPDGVSRTLHVKD